MYITISTITSVHPCVHLASVTLHLFTTFLVPGTYSIGPLLQLECLSEAEISSRHILKQKLISCKFIQGRLGSPLFCYNDKNGIQKFGLFGIAVGSQWIKLKKNNKCSNLTVPSKTRMKGFSDSKVAQI